MVIPGIWLNGLFFSLLILLLKSLHLNILKLPLVVLTHPSTSDEDPDLESGDLGTPGQFSCFQGEQCRGGHSRWQCPPLHSLIDAFSPILSLSRRTLQYICDFGCSSITPESYFLSHSLTGCVNRTKKIQLHLLVFHLQV